MISHCFSQNDRYEPGIQELESLAPWLRKSPVAGFTQPTQFWTFCTLVRVLKVLGDLLGHFSPPSPESGQNSGPESVPGLLEQFLAGSTKSAPNHLAGPTKIPLPKNPPGRVSMELLMQCNFFQCYLVNSICRGGR